MFLDKTLYSHSASLHPGVKMSTGDFNAGGNPAMDKHSIRGEVEILLVTLCYRNWDKLRPDGPLGSNADITFDWSKKSRLLYVTMRLLPTKHLKGVSRASQARPKSVSLASILDKSRMTLSGVMSR